VVLKARPDAGTGVITEVVLDGPEPQYRVWFQQGSPQIYSARHLLPAASAPAADEPLEALRAGELADAGSFRAFMTLAKLERPLADNVYSFAASRTERLPHQFKPVLKLLSNPHGRLLIADEVGLGKTIEAGIILTELGARRTLEHVLIVCPSALTEKWRREMRERFLLDFEVVNGPRFREILATETDGTPSEPRRIITSLELIRRDENLDQLRLHRPAIDVLIVDEAHHLRNTGTSSHAAGEELAAAADVAIFLTATPLNLGREDFFTLMHLLAPQAFPRLETFTELIAPNEHINAALRLLRGPSPPDFAGALTTLSKVESTAVGGRLTASPRYRDVRAVLERGAAGNPISRDEVVRCQRDLIELNTLSQVFTRTRKREVQELFPTRRPTTVAVDFTRRERAFYEAVTDWVYASYRMRAAHLVAATFQRLAASCLPALGRRLAEVVRTGALTLQADEVAELADDGLIEADQPGAFSNGGAALLDGGAAAVAVERNAASRLLDAWNAYQGAVDSKYDRFVAALTSSFRNGADRILVFSYFTGTIDYLAERLEHVTIDGRPLRVLKLYGPMDPEARERAVSAFRTSSDPVVLLSSEVGSEGLDFQFCSWMFNYDLPWNPMRVEQRIGRLDRYGQTSELIHIVNMIVSETIEERIFHRLYERIRIFEASIGDLEGILGDVEVDLARLQRDALSGRLTDAELEERRNLIADVILRRQQENEVFEEQSKRFLSNDEVFLDLFHDIERSRKYVTPEELRALVERYLLASGCRVRLEAVRQRPGVYRLTGNVPQLRTLLARTFGRTAGDVREARAFLARLHDDGLAMTFDPSVAIGDHQLEFVSLHHPLVRALAVSDDLRATLSPCAGLVVDLGIELDEPHAFFVFELHARGLKDELELAPVIVSPAGTIVDRGDELIARLESARDLASVAPPAPHVVEHMHEAALEWVVRKVAAREEDLKRRTDEAIDAQKESLRLTHDHARLRLLEQIQTSTSDRIVRMRRAQLARRETELESKLESLERKRGVSVGYRLVAAGLVASSG
jgi:superfamily II DNA or RNA helicase